MKKKGFTLIELLGVIVVLGIIATIIMPNILEIMYQAQKDNFRNSAYGLWNAAKEYYQKESEKGRYTGETIEFPSDKLEYEGDPIEKGSLTLSDDGDVELYAGKGDWCAIKAMSDSEITIADIEDFPDCGKSHGKPTIDRFEVLEELESDVTVAGVCSEEEYGISGYEYQIVEEGVTLENVLWQRTTRETFHFKNLKPHTKYVVKMRCQSKSGVYSDETETTIQTSEANIQCYGTDASGKKLEGEALTKWKNEWQKEKYLGLEFTDSEGIERSYRINQGSWQNAKIKEVLHLEKPSTVIGRMNDGSNISSLSCQVTKVDNTGPDTDAVIVASDSYSKTIKVGGYCQDEESGIVKYEYAIFDHEVNPETITTWVTFDGNLYTFNKLEEKKTYYVYVRCTNGAGMSSVGETQTKLSDATYPKCELDNLNWSNQAKKLNISYLESNGQLEVGITKKYQLLKGEATKAGGAKLTIGKEEITNNGSETLTFTTTGMASATKVKSGTNLTTSCNVTRLDMKKPRIDRVEVNPSGWYNDEKTITVEKSDEGGSGLRAYYFSRDPKQPAFSGCQTSSSGGESDNDKWICDDKGTLVVERGGTWVPSHGTTSYYLWIVDNAGNVSERREIVVDKIEKTKPTCELKIVDGTPGTNGWYTSNVKVQMISKDERGKEEVIGPSGVAAIGIYQTQGNKPNKQYTSVNDTITIQRDGINDVYGFVIDEAGNENECELKGIKVDQTKPTCAMVMKKGEATYTSGSWTKENVETTTTAVDETSKLYRIEVKHNKPNAASDVDGVDKSYSDGARTKSEKYTVSTEGINEIQGVVTDLAGNVGECTRYEVKLDKTKPICSLSKNSPTGTNQWYTGNIVAKIESQSDPSSAPDGSSSKIITRGMGTSTTPTYNGNGSYTYSSDNKSVTIYGYVKDEAGNENSCNTGALKIDKTAPSCSLYKNGSAGVENWYRSDVTVGWNSGGKDDDISGISSYTLNGVQSSNSTKYGTETDNNGHTIQATVVNGAGLSKSCSITFKIDKGLPNISYNTGSGPHDNNSGITVTNSCTDSRSGVQSKTGNQWVGSPAYGATLTATCTDKAGNTASTSRAFYVRRYGSSTACQSYQYKCGTYACGQYACGQHTCGSHRETKVVSGTCRYNCCGGCPRGWLPGSSGCNMYGEGTYGYENYSRPCYRNVTDYCTTYCTSYCTRYCTGYYSCWHY